MSETPQETFLSHLFELRDRLVRSLIAVALVFIPMFFYASELYDLLAWPMMRTLPEGSKMIATGVIKSLTELIEETVEKGATTAEEIHNRSPTFPSSSWKRASC